MEITIKQTCHNLIRVRAGTKTELVKNTFVPELQAIGRSRISLEAPAVGERIARRHD